MARLRINSCATKSYNGPLAQLVEQLTLNQRVAGSIPARPTNLIYYGGYSSVGRALDCGSEGRGFKSRYPPQIKDNETRTAKIELLSRMLSGVLLNKYDLIKELNDDSRFLSIS